MRTKLKGDQYKEILISKIYRRQCPRQGLLIQFYKCLRYSNWRISIILLLRELIGEISMWGIPLIRIGYEGIKSRKR